MLAAVYSLLCLGLVASGAAGGAGPETDEAATLAEAWTAGKFSLAFRLRYEEVADDNPSLSRDARAFTLRTAGGYQTKSWHGLQLQLEFEDVTAVGGDDGYANGAGGGLGNGVTGRPVIADPDLTEINQVRLIYAGLPGTTIDVGRREMDLGNERFVGSVGWRQNHQSFDAITVVNRSLDQVSFQYSYLDDVHRVTGDDKPMASHLFNVGAAFDAVTLTGYLYALDYDEPADHGLSTTTAGVRASGRRGFGDGAPDFLYDVELARQSDGGSNPATVDADYLRLDLGVGWKKISLRLAREVLGGERGEGAFQTPLATLHKWNGRADKFLVTPADGLEDTYALASGVFDPFAWTVCHHRFTADSVSSHYGDELDLEGTYKTHWKQTFAVAAALYDADELFFDTDKYFLWTAWGF